MLQTNAGSIWVGQKVMEKIRDESHANQRQSFLVKLTLDKVGPRFHAFRCISDAALELMIECMLTLVVVPNVARSLVLDGGHAIPHILCSWFNS